MKNYLVFYPEDTKELILGVAMGLEWFDAHMNQMSGQMVGIIMPKDNSDPYFAKDPVKMIHKDTKSPLDVVLEESSFSRIVMPYSPVLVQKYPVLLADLFQKLAQSDSLPFFQLNCSSATLRRLEEEAIVGGVEPNTPEFYCFWRISFITEIVRKVLGENASLVFQEKLFSEKEKHSGPLEEHWGSIDSEEDMAQAFLDIVKGLYRLKENRKRRLN